MANDFLDELSNAGGTSIDLADILLGADVKQAAVQAPKNIPTVDLSKNGDVPVSNDLDGIINGFPATRAGVAPSQSMADANAFIRKNREGGASQVAALFKGNQLAEQAGVRAEIGANGEISLTNIPTPQQPIALGGSGPGRGAIAPNTPLSVGSLFNQLRATKDVDEARGIGASLREAVAVEKAKFETQAQTFATNKLGLPRLQADLNAAMAADQADPKYRPGMGDSRFTAAIRTNIEQITSLAGTEAAKFLAGNAQYAVLTATAANADSELQRITRIGDRKDAVTDNLAIRSAERRQLQEDMLTDKARGIDGVTRQRVLMLNPELGTVSPDRQDADLVRTIEMRSKDKAWTSAVQAPEESLPAIAATGNQYATSLVRAKETANGIDEQQTDMNLSKLREAMQNPGLLKKGFEEQYASEPDKKKRDTLIKEGMAAFNAKGLTAEGKALNEATKADMALRLLKRNRTADFANNAGNWKIADPAFQAAVTQARQTTSGTRMEDVFNAYAGDATGPALIQKTQAFADLMTQEATKQSKSIFGAPDYLALRSQLSRKAGSSFVKWMESMGRGVASLVPDAYAETTKDSAIGVPNAAQAPAEWVDPMTQRDTNFSK